MSLNKTLLDVVTTDCGFVRHTPQHVVVGGGG